MHSHTKVKKMVAVFTIAAALVSFAAYRMARWPQSRLLRANAPAHPAPSLSGVIANTQYEARAAVKSMSAVNAVAPMSEPFESGVLPSPGAAPSSDSDAAVVTMVKQIAARDSNSLPVEMTALQMAGLGIRARDSSLLVRPGLASQGMALDAWQVAAIAKLYDEHWRISLGDLTTVLTLGLPEFRKIDLGHELIDGINSSSQGSQPLRFWSRLIIELGRNADEPYDLEAEKIDPRGVQLDSIQVSLILLRLVGDLSVVQGRYSANAKSSAHGLVPFVAPEIETAIYHPNHHARLARVADTSPGPCDLPEPLGLGLDANAILQTTEWKSLIDLEEQLEKMEHAGNLKDRINIVSTLLKFYLSYAGLNAEITMDPSPLVRTKDTSPGNEATLTAHVTYQLDKWGLNCFLAVLRPWLNLAGLDAGNLPNNGDVSGVGITWLLVDGGVNTAIRPVDQSSVDAYNATAIVEFNPGSGSLSYSGEPNHHKKWRGQLAHFRGTATARSKRLQARSGEEKLQRSSRSQV